MKRKMKHWGKKSAAIFTAAILGVSAAPTLTFAADGYSDFVLSSLPDKAKAFAGGYAEFLTELTQYESTYGTDAANGSFTLALDEAGRGFLTPLLGMDLSWAQDLTMTVDVNLQDNIYAANSDILFNGTKICSITVLMDMETQDMYVKIPEVVDGYLKYNMIEAAASISEADPATADALEQYVIAMNMDANMAEFAKFLPDAASLETLLNTYGTILLSHLENGETATETLTLDEVSQDCTVYEGKITEEVFYTTLTELLETAKDDAVLKEIIENFSTIAESETLYEDFSAAVANMLTSLEADMAVAQNSTADADAADDYFTLRLWADENNKVVGQQFSTFGEDGSEQPLFTYQRPVKDSQFELFIELTDGTDGFSVCGFGEDTDTAATGSYTFFLNDADIFYIDTNGSIDDSGNLNLTAAFGLLPGSMDAESYSFLQNFSLVWDIATDGDASVSQLILMSGEDSLGGLVLTTNPGSSIEVPDLASLENVYDMLSEEDMAAYEANTNVEGLLTNLIEAGVPEELLMAVLMGGEAPAEDTADTSAETTEDTSALETPAA